MPASEYLFLEALIARAHKLVRQGHDSADRMQLYGVAADLEQINVELARVQESMLKNPQRRATIKRDRAYPSERLI